MGTYTANKNLFMPSVGETGWGTLVNGNFETIDTFLKPISLSGSTYTFTGNQTGGSISATSITNSGTLTSTGKITGNGGIAGTTGTFSGIINANGGIKGKHYNVSQGSTVISATYSMQQGGTICFPILGNGIDTYSGTISVKNISGGYGVYTTIIAYNVFTGACVETGVKEGTVSITFSTVTHVIATGTSNSDSSGTVKMGFNNIILS